MISAKFQNPFYLAQNGCALTGSLWLNDSYFTFSLQILDLVAFFRLKMPDVRIYSVTEFGGGQISMTNHMPWFILMEADFPSLD